MPRSQLVSKSRGASITRILALVLFPGIGLLLLIPTAVITDTREIDREIAGYAQPATALGEGSGTAEHQLLASDARAKRTPTSATAPAAMDPTNTPAVGKPAASAVVSTPDHQLPATEPRPTRTPTTAPTSTIAPTVTSATDTPAIVAASSATPTPVPPTIEPLPVAQLTEIPLVATESPAAPHVAITRLVIPTIGVDAAVETRSVDPDGAMQTPGGPAVVSWYDFSSQPRDDGNAVFAGHLDYAGHGPAVFWDLRMLVAGDLIEIHQQDGSIVQYRVTEVRPFLAGDNASEVVASSGRPTITLITCDGTFDSNERAYDQRLVVTGDRID